MLENGASILHFRHKMDQTKKRACFLAAIISILLIFPSIVSADSISLKETAINNVIIKELSLPAEYEITIINDNSYSDNFAINTLLDISLNISSQTVFVPANSEKTVAIEIYPSDGIKESQNGFFAFEYYAKGERIPIEKSFILLNILPLSKAITVQLPQTVNEDDKEITAVINTAGNLEFNLGLSMNSELLEYSGSSRLQTKGKRLQFL